MPENKQICRSGMVSIVGRPNVGKSTLLNKILGEKVSIVSKVPQTTRNQIRGIFTDERGQIVFVDTPGVHKGRDQLDQFMNQSAYGITSEADVIIHLVDANDRVGMEEEELVRRFSDMKVPVILGLNKVDMKGKNISEYIALYERISGKPIQENPRITLLPLSGKDGTNVPKLIDLVFELLPEGEKLYPEDTVCDIPQKMVIADEIREKLYMLLDDELPHSIAVIIENLEQRKGKLLYIQAVIVIERDSQKSIVIGKNGGILKKAGSLARKDLEELLDTKVFLELFVKSQKDWRDSPSLLQDMGYQFM
ncbi:MAG: GTPase Era [Candidatus Omnitrophica bacterium]|nr:GTPase Era [Candidatus Omnitrophota bacterium]